MVALAYLDAVEGPMWQSIRGTGLAYGSNFFRDPETGLLKFRISKSPNVFAAYNKAKTVIKEYGNGTQKFEKLALEGAISSIVRDFVDERATVVDAARSSFIDLVTRGVGKDWQDWALREVRKVTEEDVKKILNEVVAGVFVPEKTDLVVTCGGIMTDVSSSLPASAFCVETMLTFLYRASRKTSKTPASRLRSSSLPTSKTHMVWRAKKMTTTTTTTTMICQVATTATMILKLGRKWRSRIWKANMRSVLNPSNSLVNHKYLLSPAEW
jgi:hypothetical protein